MERDNDKHTEPTINDSLPGEILIELIHDTNMALFMSDICVCVCGLLRLIEVVQ